MVMFTANGPVPDTFIGNQGLSMYGATLPPINTAPAPAPVYTPYTPYTPSIYNFNSLPKQQLDTPQPYIQPNRPTQTMPQGNQFDMSFIQQALAQRFGNQQPNTGVQQPISGPPTLTPWAAQTYGGIQGQGGLAALRSIATPTQASTL